MHLARGSCVLRGCEIGHAGDAPIQAASHSRLRKGTATATAFKNWAYLSWTAPQELHFPSPAPEEAPQRGNPSSSGQTPWHHQQLDSLPETEVGAKTFAWNIVTLKGQNRSHHITERERNSEHRLSRFLADWSWDKNATGNQVWETQDDEIYKSKSKVQKITESSTCTPHGNLFACRLTTASFSTRLKTRSSERVSIQRALSVML